jgi:repressor LexA
MFGEHMCGERSFGYSIPNTCSLSSHIQEKSTGCPQAVDELIPEPIHRVFHKPGRQPTTAQRGTMSDTLTARQRQILDVIVEHQNQRGYPPSVREIGEAVGLKSPATVKSHLDNLKDAGYLVRDPSKPRAIQVRYEGNSGANVERRPVRHVPLVGDVAAGTDVLATENIEEVVPMPADLTGDGELFMLRVRGESMIDIGIFDGDYVVCHSQTTAAKGDIVVAGIPGDEATVKTYDERNGKVVLVPHNTTLSDMVFDPSEISIYGKVVTVMRKI